jgi:hypothetical protein
VLQPFTDGSGVLHNNNLVISPLHLTSSYKISDHKLGLADWFIRNRWGLTTRGTLSDFHAAFYTTGMRGYHSDTRLICIPTNWHQMSCLVYRNLVQVLQLNAKCILALYMFHLVGV